jgi:pimeloyl-ACP methyl ester carboxylesterase
VGKNPVEYVVLADAGHMVQLERPDEVDQALTALLRRVGAVQPWRSTR